MVFGLSTFFAKAQYYLNGQDPASVKWKQINTENFQIIFPEGYEHNANEYANIFEYSHKAVRQAYLEKSKKFKLVLHNQTTTSNAMVSPTPFHGDFYEMPGQDIYAQLWGRQLALHEYRHAVQIQKMNQGLTRGLYFLLGEQAPAAMMGLFLPFWFIEGDAVFSETINSRSGRGRSPDFSMDLKAQILDKKIFSYDKAYLGSFKNKIPDYYTLGYQIVLAANAKYGNQIWDEAMNRSARKPFMLVPFTTAIKKFHGNGKVNLYKSTMEELKSKWQKEDLLKDTVGNFVLQPQTKWFTSYKFPVQVNDSITIALKTGIDDIDRFVTIDNRGREKVLFTPGFLFGNSLSANDSLICWNEKTYDPRWQMRNYSVIKIHNFKTSKTRTLTKKSRYFAPQLSHDGKKVCAVEVTRENNYYLVVIDIKTGELIKMFSTQENLFLITPQWSADDNSIVSIALGERGKTIVSFSVDNGKVEFLSDFTFLDIKYTALYGNKLIFTAPFGETNNIYLKDLKTENTFKLTNTRFDASGLKFTKDGNDIVFSEYSADGYRISKIAAKPKLGQNVDFKNLKKGFAIDEMGMKSSFVLDDSIVPHKEYEIKKFSRLGHLFNLHSWGPTVIDLDNYSFAPGINLLSQNLLSTSVAIAGYYYDLNEETGKFKFSYDYYGWYPVIKTGVEIAGRRQFYKNDSTGLYDEIRFTETDLKAGVSVPLNFTKNKWIKGMQPYIGVSQKFLKMNKDSDYKFNTDQFTSLTYQFYAYNILKRSVRDIFPKWGQNFTAVYRHTPFGQSANQQFFASTNLYFPGFVRHHGFKVYAAYQNTATSNYPYSSLLSIPRGYNNIYLEEMMSFKVDYAFPIVYPDLAIPSVVYLKRVYSHLYFDFINDLNHADWSAYESSGIELYTDWHFLGLPAVFTLGGRYSYKFDSGNSWEFLFGLGY